MTTFNTSGDPGQQNDQPGQGPSFGADQSQDKGNGGDGDGAVTQTQLAAILKRLDDKDAFIDKLKQENQELRNSQNSQPSMDDILERLNQVNQSQQPQQEPVDIDELVNKATQAATQALNENQAAELRKANFNKVQSVLSSKFGNDVDKEVKRLAAENDMTFDEAVEMAQNKPNVLLKLFGMSGNEPVNGAPTPTPETMNAHQFANQNLPQTPQKRKSLVEATTDRERIAIAKQAFIDRGLDFEYV